MFMVPVPKRCRAFVSFFLHCLYTCLLRLGVRLVGGVNWGNNVLNVLFLCIRHTLGVGLVGLGLVGAITFLHLRCISSC